MSQYLYTTKNLGQFNLCTFVDLLRKYVLDALVHLKPNTYPPVGVAVSYYILWYPKGFGLESGSENDESEFIGR